MREEEQKRGGEIWGNTSQKQSGCESSNTVGQGRDKGVGGANLVWLLSSHITLPAPPAPYLQGEYIHYLLILF